MIRALLTAALATLLSSCNNNVTSRTLEPFRYKLTAEVETPGGVRIGSSVIEVQWSIAGSMFGSQGGSGVNVTGEAVAVDLPKGGTLFVLLRSKGDTEWASAATDAVPVRRAETPPNDRSAMIDAVADYVRRLKLDRGVYPAQSKPYFVRFANTSDPKSVQEVNPDDLAASYGKGFALKSLTVQMTDAPVTTGIGKRLPWIAAMEKHSFDEDGPFDEKYPVILTGLRKR